MTIMAFKIENKIKGKIYVYEAESVWDKDKKQSRLRRKYIGKKNPETKEIIPPKHTVSPQFICKDYGNYNFLKSISDKIGLTSVLQNVYPESYNEILISALFGISEERPLYLCDAWTNITATDCKSNLSSQRLSELLRDIGMNDNQRLHFFNEWREINTDTKHIVFDITAISSYSKNIDYIEWGKNKDDEKLPQVNIGLVLGEPSELPLFYTRYPGSIKDVSTLKNLTAYNVWLKLKKTIFVLDRGFFSGPNIKQLSDEGFTFIMPLPFSTNISKELIKKHSKEITHHTKSFMYNDSIYYQIKDTVKINGISLNAYIYYDERRKCDEMQMFLAKVIECEIYISKNEWQSISEIESYLKEIFGKEWNDLFSIKHTKAGHSLKRNDIGFDILFDRMGKMILLTNNQSVNAFETLSLYRRKDRIEKLFQIMKNELDGNRLRVHSKKNFEGRLFVFFISLIVYAAIDAIMRKNNLYKKYSMNEIIYELKKIKLLELPNGQKIISEFSKKQKDIFKIFDISLPEVAT